MVAPWTKNPYTVEAVIADKGYDCESHEIHSDAFVVFVEAKATKAVIPFRRNRKEHKEMGDNLYKDGNKIEQFFNRLKHYRRIATRYEKTGRNYLAFVYLASIMTLLL